MLMMRFTLKVFDGIHAKYFMNGTADLGFSIVTEQCIGSTMLTNEILKSTGHFIASFHRVPSSEQAFAPTVELQHGCTTVTHDAIIMGRNIRKECICGNSVIEPTDVGSRKAAFEMLAQRKAGIHSCKLRCVGDRVLNSSNRDKTKMWFESIKVMLLGLNNMTVHDKSLMKGGVMDMVNTSINITRMGHSIVVI